MVLHKGTLANARLKIYKGVATIILKGGLRGLSMNLEIQKPELAQRVQEQIQSGHFHNVDELIEKALDALEEQATGAVVLAALQARPYPDIDLTPPRVRLTNVRDVVL